MYNLTHKKPEVIGNKEVTLACGRVLDQTEITNMLLTITEYIPKNAEGEQDAGLTARDILAYSSGVQYCARTDFFECSRND